MNIWKLIPHHESQEQQDAYLKYVETGYLAIGWNDVGDLVAEDPQGFEDIQKLIEEHYPNANNAPQGGRSLWKLYAQMEEGDYVIVSGGRMRGVMEVTGPYEYRPVGQEVYEYQHVRQARLTQFNARELWKKCNGQVADGGPYDTLVCCIASDSEKERLFDEGARARHEATRIERDPMARAECLRVHGYSCMVCKANFGQEFGPAGEGYIHVHHLTPLSTREGPHKVDPAKDLVPLCPNCHGMAHRRQPPYTIKELVKFRRAAELKR